jgi:hypothetical protein
MSGIDLATNCFATEIVNRDSWIARRITHPETVHLVNPHFSRILTNPQFCSGSQTADNYRSRLRRGSPEGASDPLAPPAIRLRLDY